MPGDPIDLMVSSDPNLTPADAARLRALYGLDLPIWTRYLNWLSAALQGDLGYSRLFARPVPEIILPRLLNTLLLLSVVLVLALAIALPLGVYAARRPRSGVDTVINLACFAGISVPPFWLALLFIMLFAVALGVLPAGGMAPVGGDGGMAERLPYLIMPVATLTLVSVGGYTRYIRAAMLEQLRQDYVRTARAKGVPEQRVVWRHALRNALIPVVTIVALEFGTLFSGALITETMFAYLGMGKLIYESVLGNDYNVALVGLLLATLMTLVGNLLADMAYAALDPRITFTETRT
jgi:peptide/nickel transport system permease protein